MRRSIQLGVALLLLVGFAVPVHAAKKNKTKGLPPASNVPDVDDTAMKDAKSKLALAQGRLEKAQDTLTTLVARLRKEGETAPARAQGEAALKQAQADYDAAAGPVLEKVRASAKYQRALDEKKAATKRVDELNADPATPQEPIAEAARVVLEKGTAVSAIERGALEADANVQRSKAQLDDANKRLLKAKYEFEQSLKNNPEIAEARRQVDQAKDEIPPLQSAYDSALAKYNQDVAAHDKAVASEAGNRTGSGDGTKTGGSGARKKHKKKL
ncbi:MAG TPA: hypothetical protein VH475_17190 [Tepidisphaeraceae bacterium]|jgi:hypothetical protein